MPVWEQGAEDSLHEAKRSLDRVIQEYDKVPRGTEMEEFETPLLEIGAELDTTLRELFNAGDIAGMRCEVDYRVIYHRRHETGAHPRIRVWTRQQAAYGQFEVVSHEEFRVLQRVLGNMGYIFQEGQE